MDYKQIYIYQDSSKQSTIQQERVIRNTRTDCYELKPNLFLSYSINNRVHTPDAKQTFTPRPQFSFFLFLHIKCFVLKDTISIYNQQFKMSVTTRSKYNNEATIGDFLGPKIEQSIALIRQTSETNPIRWWSSGTNPICRRSIQFLALKIIYQIHKTTINHINNRMQSSLTIETQFSRRFLERK